MDLSVVPKIGDGDSPERAGVTRASVTAIEATKRSLEEKRRVLENATRFDVNRAVKLKKKLWVHLKKEDEMLRQTLSGRAFSDFLNDYLKQLDVQLPIILRRAEADKVLRSARRYLRRADYFLHLGRMAEFETEYGNCQSLIGPLLNPKYDNSVEVQGFLVQFRQLTEKRLEAIQARIEERKRKIEKALRTPSLKNSTGLLRDELRKHLSVQHKKLLETAAGARYYTATTLYIERLTDRIHHSLLRDRVVVMTSKVKTMVRRLQMSLDGKHLDDARSDHAAVIRALTPLIQGEIYHNMPMVLRTFLIVQDAEESLVRLLPSMKDRLAKIPFNVRLNAMKEEVRRSKQLKSHGFAHHGAAPAIERRGTSSPQLNKPQVNRPRVSVSRSNATLGGPKSPAMKQGLSQASHASIVSGANDERKRRQRLHSGSPLVRHHNNSALSPEQARTRNSLTPDAARQGSPYSDASPGNNNSPSPLHREASLSPSEVLSVTGSLPEDNLLSEMYEIAKKEEEGVINRRSASADDEETGAGAGAGITEAMSPAEKKAAAKAARKADRAKRREHRRALKVARREAREKAAKADKAAQGGGGELATGSPVKDAHMKDAAGTPTADGGNDELYEVSDDDDDDDDVPALTREADPPKPEKGGDVKGDDAKGSGQEDKGKSEVQQAGEGARSDPATPPRRVAEQETSSESKGSVDMPTVSTPPADKAEPGTPSPKRRPDPVNVPSSPAASHEEGGSAQPTRKHPKSPLGRVTSPAQLRSPDSPSGTPAANRRTPPRVPLSMSKSRSSSMGRLIAQTRTTPTSPLVPQRSQSAIALVPPADGSQEEPGPVSHPNQDGTIVTDPSSGKTNRSELESQASRERRLELEALRAAKAARKADREFRRQRRREKKAAAAAAAAAAHPAEKDRQSPPVVSTTPPVADTPPRLVQTPESTVTPPAEFKTPTGLTPIHEEGTLEILPRTTALDVLAAEVATAKILESARSARSARAHRRQSADAVSSAVPEVEDTDTPGNPLDLLDELAALGAKQDRRAAKAARKADRAHRRQRRKEAKQTLAAVQRANAIVEGNAVADG